MSGPQSGPQPEVKQCPRCMGKLANVASRTKQPPNSHSYQCEKCKHRFEINDLGD